MISKRHQLPFNRASEAVESEKCAGAEVNVVASERGLSVNVIPHYAAKAPNRVRKRSD